MTLNKIYSVVKICSRQSHGRNNYYIGCNSLLAPHRTNLTEAQASYRNRWDWSHGEGSRLKLPFIPTASPKDFSWLIP